MSLLTELAASSWREFYNDAAPTALRGATSFEPPLLGGSLEASPYLARCRAFEAMVKYAEERLGISAALRG